MIRSMFMDRSTNAYSFARQLERELNEAKKDSARLDWMLEQHDEGGIECTREMIDIVMQEESEPTTCENCDGIGELPGDPNSKIFPTCSRCNGTGNNNDND